MIDIKNCKTLNDIARQEFGKANYNNREKCKKLLEENGINWKDWLESKKRKKETKYCLQCGKKLSGLTQLKFCSRSCSASFNNKKKILSEETKTKISYSIQKRNPNFNGLFKTPNFISNKNKCCLNCGKELDNKRNLYCNIHCFNEHKYNKYIKRWKNNENDGLKGEYGISNHIRRYLMEKNDYKCEKCGWGYVNEFTNKIPLELHHIDGNYLNNKEENLQLLCPNCHSLTETYKFHNKIGRLGRRKYYK